MFSCLYCKILGLVRIDLVVFKKKKKRIDLLLEIEVMILLFDVIFSLINGCIMYAANWGCAVFLVMDFAFQMEKKLGKKFILLLLLLVLKLL